jgi:hypothetical protein
MAPTKEEILEKKFFITEETKYHVWDYVYKSILSAMEEYAQQSSQEKITTCMYCEKKLKPGEAIVLCKECTE